MSSTVIYFAFLNKGFMRKFSFTGTNLEVGNTNCNRICKLVNITTKNTIIFEFSLYIYPKLRRINIIWIEMLRMEFTDYPAIIYNYVIMKEWCRIFPCSHYSGSAYGCGVGQNQICGELLIDCVLIKRSVFLKWVKFLEA